MNRLIQFIQLFIKGKILNAHEHYSNEMIVRFYQEFNPQKLFDDEREVFDSLMKEYSNSSRLLVIGAGTGRESVVFKDYFQEIIAFEPVEAMFENAINPEAICWIKDLDKMPCEKVDIIWLTRYLPSLLSNAERIILYKKLMNHLADQGVIVLKPDVMCLSWKESFRFKLASLILKYRVLKNDWQEGDTVRQNLDFNSLASGLVYYHYYQSENDCFLDFQKKSETKKLKYSLMPLGFIKIQLP